MVQWRNIVDWRIQEGRHGRSWIMETKTRTKNLGNSTSPWLHSFLAKNCWWSRIWSQESVHCWTWIWRMYSISGQWMRACKNPILHHIGSMALLSLQRNRWQWIQDWPTFNHNQFWRMASICSWIWFLANSQTTLWKQ